jgi:nicotinate-nucleotide pyrophosphorylase (carboxylating)
MVFYFLSVSFSNSAKLGNFALFEPTNMKKEYQPFVERLIELAIAEDIGDGDHTSLASIPAAATGRMKLLVKEPGIIAGVEVAAMVFRRLDPAVKFEVHIPDGTPVTPGDVVFHVSGRVRTLLQSERIVLNIMQRMTGVATETARYVARVAGTGCRILDTRKTTPGSRVLDKMAVKFGGGENHRMGLFDMILLKDNHIDFAGGIIPALRGVRTYMAERGLHLPIEVEVRTLEDIDKVFAEGGPVDRIMLDNFALEATRRAVAKIAGLIEVESSGGIRYENLRDYADTGVDYISIGALTHQIKSVDLSLKAAE